MATGPHYLGRKDSSLRLLACSEKIEARILILVFQDEMHNGYSTYLRYNSTRSMRSNILRMAVCGCEAGESMNQGVGLAYLVARVGDRHGCVLIALQEAI
jgi:hypothetical protein